MAGIGALIVNVLTGGLAQKVLDFLASRDQARIDTMNDAERRGFEERQTMRANAQQIRMATATFWEMRVMTFLIAFPFVVHINLVGLDTNFRFGWGIPKFPAPMDEWEATILLSFFGVATLASVTKAVVLKGIVRTGRERGLTQTQKPP